MGVLTPPSAGEIRTSPNFAHNKNFVGRGEVDNKKKGQSLAHWVISTTAYQSL
jgi:hypothetical protein